MITAICGNSYCELCKRTILMEEGGLTQHYMEFHPRSNLTRKRKSMELTETIAKQDEMLLDAKVEIEKLKESLKEKEQNTINNYSEMVFKEIESIKKGLSDYSYCPVGNNGTCPYENVECTECMLNVLIERIKKR